MVKRSSYVIAITLIFSMMNFLIMPEHITYSFFILLVPGILLLIYTKSFNISYWELSLIVICMLFLLFSQYSTISTVLLWLSYLFIKLLYNNFESAKTTKRIEKILWSVVLLLIILSFIYQPDNDVGDFKVGGNYDGNYSGVIVFLLFMYAVKRRLRGGGY